MKMFFCLFTMLATLCTFLHLEAIAISPTKAFTDKAQVKKKISEVKASYAATYPDNPLVQIDPSGNAVALWQEDGLNTLINAATSASFGKAWTAPVLLSDPSLNSSIPTLVMDSNGNAFAFWLSGYSLIGCDGLYAAILPSGESWSTPVMLSTTDEAVFANYTVDINADGQVI